MQKRGNTPTMTARGQFERYTFETGPMENNVYLLVTPQTREAVLIDASDEAERIANEVVLPPAATRPCPPWSSTAYPTPTLSPRWSRLP